MTAIHSLRSEGQARKSSDSRTPAPLESNRWRKTKSWEDLAEHYLRIVEDEWYRGLVELQDAISIGTLEFFSSRGLRNVHLPITTASISSPMGLGSDSKPVKINLFGVETYLADSMQFMLEYACRLHPQGAYYLMPSFRGEDADKAHLCQFYHAEAEIIGSFDDVTSLVEGYVRSLTGTLVQRCNTTLKRLVGDLSHVDALLNRPGPLPRVTLDEAVELLGHHPDFVRKHEPHGFRTITREGERMLIERFGGFVWLVEPDHMAVPFYQAFTDASQSKARAGDLLFGMGEVVGSGERHASAEQVKAALLLHQVGFEAYEWYWRMRERYPLQTSGFGMGTERYLCWLLRHDDVRDCQLLPRFNGEATIP